MSSGYAYSEVTMTWLLILLGTGFIIFGVYSLIKPLPRLPLKRTKSWPTPTPDKIRKRVPFLWKEVNSALRSFIRTHGHNSIQNTATAVVMRTDYLLFMTQDADSVKPHEGILAVAYVKETECYPGLRTVLRRVSGNGLEDKILDQLADQLTIQLLKNAPHFPPAPANSAPAGKCVAWECSSKSMGLSTSRY
jgi:hypothetical protein